MASFSTYALEALKPTSNLNIDDKCYVLETNKYYQVDNNNNWILSTDFTYNPQVYIAGQILGGQRVVMLSLGKAVYFDITDENNLGFELGITNQSAALNDKVIILKSGLIVNPGWNLTPNSIYYAGTNGTITTTIPNAPCIQQKIGVSINEDTLKLNFSEPISII